MGLLFCLGYFMIQLGDRASADLSVRFEAALVYATRLHADQYRKGRRVPYIAHLLSVAALVLEAGGDEDAAIAALLHDAVEDQGGKPTCEAIRQQFGDRVAAIVSGCRMASVRPKPAWTERKQRYIDQIRQGDAAVQLVSLADKLHNARSILMALREEGESIWSRFKGGKTGTLAVYRSLLTIYQTAHQRVGTDGMMQEFERVIWEIETFQP